MIFYRLYKNNNSMSRGYGKWYGRTVITEAVGIDRIAQKMQDSCTVKRSDVKAVLEELGPTIKELLQDSKRVIIPSLGSFKLGINTKGEDNIENWSPVNDIRRVKVLFAPETTSSYINGKRRRIAALTEGSKFGEVPAYVKDESENSGEQGDGE